MQSLSARTKGPEVTLTGLTFYPATRLRLRLQNEQATLTFSLLSVKFLTYVESTFDSLLISAA
jgi:hypothetical protein